jgi:hypothetical protein
LPPGQSLESQVLPGLRVLLEHCLAAE